MSEAAVSYNPFQPGFTEDPYPHYRELREADPVHRSPMEVWMLFAYADVFRMLRDPALSVEDRNAHATPLFDLAQEVLGDQAEGGSDAMLNRDPPDHTRLRRLVSKAFTPRMVERLRPRIAALVDQALGEATGPEWDVIEGLAFPLPFQVISELLGTPETDTAQLREWSGLLVRSLEPVPDPDLLVAIADASRHMDTLVREIILWKRDHPADDLLSGLIAVEDDGEALSEQELVDQVALLYIAGHETTVNLIGNGTFALLRHPDQLERLRADPELITNAVEELLRFDSPVQMSRRITREPMDLGGKVIEPGAFVVLGLGAANRDPAQWGDDADELDLGRAHAGQHLSFGGGHHHCLGAALARLEAQIAIGTMVRRFPHLDLAGEPDRNGRINLRGLQHLPVVAR